MSNKLKLYEFKYKDRKGSVIYDEEDKSIYFYKAIIPAALVKDIKVSASLILRYHTTPIFNRKVRKEPKEQQLKKELLKVLKKQG